MATYGHKHVIVIWLMAVSYSSVIGAKMGHNFELSTEARLCVMALVLDIK